MTPSVFNRVCARPVVISCTVGACVLNVIVLAMPHNGVRIISIATDWEGWAFLILAIVATTGLGFFLGMFTCWPWIRPICSKFNGAPFTPGDHVVILTGPLQGSTAEVTDITKGQGGWDVVWLDLGPEHEKTFSNIFEEYSLMKTTKGERDSVPNICTHMTGRWQFAKKWLLILVVVVALYAGLLHLTHRFGAPQIRSIVVEAMHVPPNYRDVSDGRDHVSGPYYYCSSRAYAPFLVRIDYGLHGGPLYGDGGSTLYLWLFGPGFRIRELEHWAE